MCHVSGACIKSGMQRVVGKSKSPCYGLIYDVIYHEQELGGQMYALVFPRAV